MRKVITAAAIAACAAAAVGAGDPDYYVRDFYLGMPLADFVANFGARATETAAGTYVYAGYPDEGMELVFSEVLGSQYLTSITATAVVTDYEEGIRDLTEAFGEVEYDSRWVPANDDCNRGPTPVRTMTWYVGYDVDLVLRAKKNFEGQEPPGDMEVEARLTMTDGRERDGRHPWVERKLTGDN